MERLTYEIKNKNTGAVLAYSLKSDRDGLKAVQKLGAYERADALGLLGSLVYIIRQNDIVGTPFKINMLNEYGKTVFRTFHDAKLAMDTRNQLDAEFLCGRD